MSERTPHPAQDEDRHREAGALAVQSESGTPDDALDLASSELSTMISNGNGDGNETREPDYGQPNVILTPVPDFLALFGGPSINQRERPS